MKIAQRIAVRDLVSHVLASGDLVVQFTGAARLADAIRAHQRIQNSRPEGYQPEVTVSRTVETDRFSLMVSGRIDGVWQKPDETVVEEIKTTLKPLKDFEDRQNPLHWAQATCYAYMVAEQQQLERVGVQLTYVHLESFKTLTVKQTFTRNQLKADFDDLVSRYVRWVETMVDWIEIRNAALADLRLPYPDYRPGQRPMAVAVYRAIRDRHPLLIQAATGIGKTMAVLLPAVKSLAADHSSKIFYLTARTTGQHAAREALRLMRDKGLRIKSLVLTAKDKICFNPEAACTPDECDYAKGYYDRLEPALRALFGSQDAFTRQRIVAAATEHQICPFEFSLALSLTADVIICDYNYAFDPRVYLRRFFDDPDGDWTLLVDEAHNMVDRSREMFSATLAKQTFLDLRRAVKKDLPEIYRQLGRINSWFLKQRKKCPDTEAGMSQSTPPAGLDPLLRTFLRQADRWLAQNMPADFADELLELYFAVNAFERTLEGYNDCYATLTVKEDQDLTVKLFCLDPSAQLASALGRCRTAIFFSATLTPLDYFADLLGCDASAGRIVLPSPFPSGNLCLLIADRISTRYRQRDATKTAVGRALATTVKARRGNYMLYFPSYAYLQSVRDLFDDQLENMPIGVQSPDMTETQRDDFLATFRGDAVSAQVAFAVMGGIFGEGIDLVGERLTGAVIVGVGLPAICVERELIRSYFDANQRDGFDYAYTYPGINRVLQAAGRVIRSETDRGVVLLIDERFGTVRYRNLLPSHWQPQKVRNDRELIGALRRFWQL